jgi:hypothetical protein
MYPALHIAVIGLFPPHIYIVRFLDSVFNYLSKSFFILSHPRAQLSLKTFYGALARDGRGAPMLPWPLGLYAPPLSQ